MRKHLLSIRITYWQLKSYKMLCRTRIYLIFLYYYLRCCIRWQPELKIEVFKIRSPNLLSILMKLHRNDCQVTLVLKKLKKFCSVLELNFSNRNYDQTESVWLGSAIHGPCMCKVLASVMYVLVLRKPNLNYSYIQG